MLLNFDILREFDSTNERLRKIFTAEKGTPEGEIRDRWEERISGRIREGATFNLKNHKLFAAADLAWDGNIITKELIPLQLYAQGKIDVKSLVPMLNELSPETVKQFVRTDEKNNITGIDIPEFHKVVVSLVRSFVTRRTAAIATRYVNLFPLYKYEPFSTSHIARLRADVLSQRIEMNTNAFNYRHDLVQSIRNMLLYPYHFEFVTCAWERELQLRLPKNPGDMSKRDSDGKLIVESFVTREGNSFAQPHPSRVFWDQSHSPATLNTDTGLSYIGYWHVTRYGSVRKNTRYFNREKIAYSIPYMKELAGYAGYWALYFANSPINFPTLSDAGADLSGENDREKNIGVYSPTMDDNSVLLTEYFEKVIPKEAGFGEYPFPVWVRLVIGGDRTVVHAEILPSTPGVYYGFNNHDGRLMNASFALDIIPYQDQLSNMLTNLLHAQKSALIKILGFDMDQIPESIRKQIQAIIEQGSLYTRPLYMEFKSSQAVEVGVNPKQAVTISETDAIQDVTTYFRSIMQLLGIAERLLGVSAFENAQSEPREVSATESVNIAQTVNTSLAFMSLGVDEAIDAKKKLLYEAFMAMGPQKVTVPVAGRYQPSTIKAAGFTLVEEQDTDTEETNYQFPKRVTVTGNKDALVYDYTFTSRDGSERPSSVKSAEVLVQLLAQLQQMPGVLDALGKERLYGILNAIGRMVDAGDDLQFEVQDGEDAAVPPGDAVLQSKEELNKVIGQILQAIQQDRQAIQQLTALVQNAAPPMGQPPAMPAAAPAQPITQ